MTQKPSIHASVNKDITSAMAQSSTEQASSILKASTTGRVAKTQWRQNLNKTTLLTAEEAKAARKWFLLDASGKTLGRFASQVAQVLRGKHKVSFTSHVDGGDGVVIINADKIKVTGQKATKKIYRYYTGYMSGLREVPFEVMLARNPDYIVRHAVKGMMPKTRLSEHQMRKLRIFSGDQHDLQAQNPIPVNL
jgi:large subunit ribosomal protein L13